MEDIVIGKSRFKIGCSAFILLIVSIILGVIVFMGDLDSIGKFIAGAFFLFMLGFVVFYFIQFMNSKPLLILKDEGFYNYSTIGATGDRLIRWDEVDHIDLIQYGNQKNISVFLKNPEETLKDAKATSKALSSINNGMMDAGHINIIVRNASGITSEECAVLMMQILEDKQHKQNITEKLSGLGEAAVQYFEDLSDRHDDERATVLSNRGYVLTVELDNKYQKAPDVVQMQQVILTLQEIVKQPSVLAKLSSDDIDDIEKGMLPKGYTLHHHEVPCKFELVPQVLHNETPHLGGNVLWGGKLEL
ncbi:STM3941 family protein [Macrococcus armenti]|uniref:HNH endonuclease n=1 Tax=Macrococcus armenti TaxID=2875764 RepID=A0ABY3ZV58_9STAP|nr:STM3941 family protein [Macrococcus armenti]UOB20792.1 HNH endonuclease [Macrococcus armenti]